MGREFELKYAATEQVLNAVASQYGPGRKIQMETTYFDTRDHALSAACMTLRLRRENEETVATLKTSLADGSRGEWECAATDIESAMATLLALGAPEDLKELTQSGVIPVCGARFTRIAVELPIADGMAELALDRGILMGGGQEAPLCEVELELKSGSEEALLTLARQLETIYHLQPEADSKFRRAMALNKGE